MTRPIPGALILLTALCGAVSVAVAALPVMSRYSAADQVFAAATQPKPVQDNPRLDLTPIIDFAPFGRAAPAAIAAADAAPSTLTLQGVSVSPDRASSRAIIAGGQGDSTSYAVGDIVAAGMTLTDIATDHVTFTTDAGVQRLDFPGLAAAQDTDTDIQTPGFSAKLQNLIPVADPVSPTLKTLRDQLNLNPQSLLTEYAITASADGYLIGTATPVAETGLQPGDLVTQINGREVGNIAEDRRFLDEVAAQGEATFVVVRGGEPLTLQVTLP